MMQNLERLLRDATLVTLALAIAFGWSLYQLAHGVAYFVQGLLTHLPAGVRTGSNLYPGGSLTWFVGNRILTLDGILEGFIELTVVAVVALRADGRRWGLAVNENPPGVARAADCQVGSAERGQRRGAGRVLRPGQCRTAW